MHPYTFTTCVHTRGECVWVKSWLLIIQRGLTPLKNTLPSTNWKLISISLQCYYKNLQEDDLSPKNKVVRIWKGKLFRDSTVLVTLTNASSLTGMITAVGCFSSILAGAVNSSNFTVKSSSNLFTNELCFTTANCLQNNKIIIVIIII